jgi:hypothetical protein
MRKPSIADELKRRDRERFLQLSLQERLDLIFRLGDEDLEMVCGAQGLDRQGGLALLRRRRQQGRQPSACMAAAGR